MYFGKKIQQKPHALQSRNIARDIIFGAVFKNKHLTSRFSNYNFLSSGFQLLNVKMWLIAGFFDMFCFYNLCKFVPKNCSILVISQEIIQSISLVLWSWGKFNWCVFPQLSTHWATCIFLFVLHIMYQKNQQTKAMGDLTTYFTILYFIFEI